MIAAGYERSYYSVCKGCKQAIEWWNTPNGQHIPMNSMNHPDSPAVSHFATCPNADQFRKEPHRCTPIYPTSTLPDSQPSLFSPESLSSPEPLSTDKHDDESDSKK
jgi:hypothetical protein